MKVAFTGTRQGMSAAQRRSVAAWINLLNQAHIFREFHHGAAIGADQEAVAMADDGHVKIVEHPAGADPLARNRAMVDLCDLLIACPAKRQEELRSGTWATIRYARRQGVPTLTVWP